MFTGLVEKMAEVAEARDEPPGRRLIVRVGEIAGEVRIGDSIALNGCCLTVVAIDGDCLEFEAGPETLSLTNLGALAAGSHVNIERSLRVGDSLGGHFVTGHVDGLGRLERRERDGEWETLWFAAPEELMAQTVRKGSIAVDGVSLTVVDTTRSGFSVQLIPHTLAVTTLGRLKVGDPVNLETDMLAKHVQKQIAAYIGAMRPA